MDKHSRNVAAVMTAITIAAAAALGIIGTQSVQAPYNYGFVPIKYAMMDYGLWTEYYGPDPDNDYPAGPLGSMIEAPRFSDVLTLDSSGNYVWHFDETYGKYLDLAYTRMVRLSSGGVITQPVVLQLPMLVGVGDGLEDYTPPALYTTNNADTRVASDGIASNGIRSGYVLEGLAKADADNDGTDEFIGCGKTLGYPRYDDPNFQKAYFTMIKELGSWFNSLPAEKKGMIAAITFGNGVDYETYPIKAVGAGCLWKKAFQYSQTPTQGVYEIQVVSGKEIPQDAAGQRLTYEEWLRFIQKTGEILRHFFPYHVILVQAGPSPSTMFGFDGSNGRRDLFTDRWDSTDTAYNLKNFGCWDFTKEEFFYGVCTIPTLAESNIGYKTNGWQARHDSAEGTKGKSIGWSNWDTFTNSALSGLPIAFEPAHNATSYNDVYWMLHIALHYGVDFVDMQKSYLDILKDYPTLRDFFDRNLGEYYDVAWVAHDAEYPAIEFGQTGTSDLRGDLEIGMSLNQKETSYGVTGDPNLEAKDQTALTYDWTAKPHEYTRHMRTCLPGDDCGGVNDFPGFEDNPYARHARMFYSTVVTYTFDITDTWQFMGKTPYGQTAAVENPGYKLKVIWFDNGSFTWYMQYPDYLGVWQQVPITGTNSSTWQEFEVNIDDAQWNTGTTTDLKLLPNGNDVIVHKIWVEPRWPGGRPTPTPTPTPTNTPTPTPTPSDNEPAPEATVVVLTPVADTYLSSWQPNTIMDTVYPNVLSLRSISAFNMLLKFDVSSVSGTIQQVKLKIKYTSSSNDRSHAGYVYRVLVSWDENATWNKRDSSNNWTVGGALGEGSDHDPNPYGEFINASSDKGTWKTINIDPTLVQNWLNGTFTNYGILLVADNHLDGMSKVEYTTSSVEGGDPPQLEITYLPGDIPPPEPPPSVTVVELEPIKDADIDAYATTTNTGTNTYLRVRSNNIQKTLLQFDLSTIPITAEVSWAGLKRHVDASYPQSNANPHDEAIYRLYRDWDETAVTWITATTGITWETAGADGPNDREVVPIGITTVGDISTTTWITIPITPEAIEAWLDGTLTNKGMVVQSTSSTAVEKRFYSREYTVGYRPLLRLEYYVPTPTPTPYRLSGGKIIESQESYSVSGLGVQHYYWDGSTWQLIPSSLVTSTTTGEWSYAIDPTYWTKEWVKAKLNLGDYTADYATSGCGSVLSSTEIQFNPSSSCVDNTFYVIAPTATPTPTPTSTPTPTPTPTATAGYVTGFVYEDKDSNGIFTLPDIGLSNIMVYIWGSGTPVATPVSESNGYYLAEVLNGTYSIAITPPAGYSITTTSPVSITINPAAYTGQDFGLVTNTPTPTPTNTPTPTPTPTPTWTPTPTPTSAASAPTPTPTLSVSDVVYINEYLHQPDCTKSQNYNNDFQCDNDDAYIEIRSTKSTQVDLENWRIDIDGTTYLTFPAGAILVANSRKVLFCSDMSCTSGLPYTGTVTLYDDTGTIIDSITLLGTSNPGVAQGRVGDDKNLPWQWLSANTPGRYNPWN